MIRSLRMSLAFMLAAIASLGSSAAFAHHLVGQIEIMRGVIHVAEQPPDLVRRCIPGPHEVGRVRRLPGIAATISRAWAYEPDVDAYPHCRDDGR